MQTRKFGRGAGALLAMLATVGVTIHSAKNSAAASPNVFLQQELVAELNSMVDKYRTLVGTSLSQNEKELKVRTVTLLGADEQFMYAKFDVRIRERNGLTGAILYTQDGSARGKFRWGQITADRACATAGLQEFSCLAVTSIADIPHISGPDEAEAAKRAIQANFPREVCALMWPTIRVAGTVATEKAMSQSRHPSLRPNKLVFTVILSNHSARNVKVKFGTADGTAKAGIDYQAATGELLIPSGTKSKTIEIPIIPRDGNQGSRQMLFNIWSPINGKIVDNQAIGIILDTGQTVPGGAVPPP